MQVFCWPLKFCFFYGSFQRWTSARARVLSRTSSIRRLLHRNSTQTHFFIQAWEISNLYWKRCADNEKLGGAEKWGASEWRPRGLQCQNTCMWSPTVSSYSYSWHLSQTHTHSQACILATTSYTCSARGMVRVRYSYKYTGLQVCCLKECSKLWCACILYMYMIRSDVH